MSARNVDIPIVGDCKSILQQLIDAIDGKTADRFQGWRQKLAEGEAAKRQGPGGNWMHRARRDLVLQTPFRASPALL
jgi:thiamine pyrophosphate-dependent acetolactate synthase large subunit-like protein